jgi:chaperone LolA
MQMKMMMKKKMKSLATILALLFLAAPLFGAGEMPPAETEALIARMREHRAKFPSLTAEFTEEKTTHLLNKPIVISGSLAFEVPNHFRREVKGNNPSLTVSNGKTLWIYYPNFKEAELYTIGAQSLFDDSIAALTAGLNFQNIGDYYHYSAFREGDGYRFQLKPKTAGLKRMLRELAVVVSADFLIQKTEATLPKGDRVVTVYRNQKPAPVPAGTFDFKPPADAHVSTPLGK